ncbi:MAG: hypothetical protein A2937_03500 [Candidatus Yonathbacteria bacterium RIFCSPLOWO2_01_FULL_47_33b]|uniref:Peptidoglycan binding-like domain-containing protein n=1 Tax=Candidatus Yonathbacteria bacterium RIFCSPLOWO2_01_FULL_47_33b TaxID=1802727 RepID=A0A1G2SEF9_9BACT|nr:MAG: hypothetical protein A2937_03500 [Candidatus Yonathbacteria bacterium RIFCSPLOWO2_01_FULL_47_33b]
MNHVPLQKKGLSSFFIIAVVVLCVTFNVKNTTAVSPIDNLQPGEWYEVPNSKIRAVLPNPIPPGNGPTNIIKAWNGGAYDTRRDNFIVWGGGHGDYAGNEIYSFNIGTLQWSRAWGPSANASMGLPGTPVCSETYTDGMPASRHTYGGIEFLPNVDKFFSMGGSLWCGPGNPTGNVWTFDFSTQGWTQKGAITPLAGRWGGLGLGVNTAYDPNTGHLFATSPAAELLEYDPTTDIWKLRGNTAAKYSMTSAIDSKRKHMVTIGNASTYGVIDTPGTIYRYNLATVGTITQEKIVSTGATEILVAPAPAFQYDPVSDQYVAWKGGSDIYTLNPDTFVWTRRPAAATNTVTPSQPTEWGTFGRFRYIPSKNAFILVNSIDQNVYIYKLSQGAGSTAPSTPVVPIVAQSADTTAPTVSITSPGTGASISGTITVSASATDAGGMTGVQFKIDGAVLGAEDTTSPYSVSLNTALFSNGAHSLTAIARDKAGNQKTSATVSVIIASTTTTTPGANTTPPTETPSISYGTTTVTQIDIPSGVFVALDRPDRGRGVSGLTKHTTWAHNPIDGRMYQTGGDFAGSVGQSSYQQESYSISIAERFANKTDKNAGWHKEYPYCSPVGGIQPKSPDFVGWTWDSLRKVFWFVPGLSVTPGSTFCAGETTTGASDPQYLFNHIMTFNPFETDLAKRWSDYDANPGPNYYATWQSDYDSQTDTLIRFGTTGCCGAVVNIYDIKTKTWSEYKLGTNALNKDIRIWGEGHAADIPGRAIYVIDGIAGRIFRYNIDRHNITDLGPVPGGTIIHGGSNDTYLAWDPIHKIVFFFRVDTNTLHIYHPDTNTWESPAIVSSPLGITPHTRHGMAFDPYQNVLVLFGHNDEVNIDPYMYLYRYASGGNAQYTVTTTPPASTNTTSTAGTTGSTATVVDTTPPAVTITNPYSNTVVTGTIAVMANASDASGIGGVQFMIDTIAMGVEDVISPYSQLLDTTTLSNGVHGLTAIARDKAGNKKASTAVVINVSNVLLGTTSGTKEQTVTTVAPSTGATGSSSGVSSGNTQQTATTNTASATSGSTSTGNTSSGSIQQTTSATNTSGVGTSGVIPQTSTPSVSTSNNQSKATQVYSGGGAPSPVNPMTYGYSGGGSVGVSSPSVNTQVGQRSAVLFEKPLYLGLKDQEVVRLQQVLISKGYLPSGNDSGYFGALTHESVKRFQCDQKIVCGGNPSDTGYGLVGSSTRSKLNEILIGGGSSSDTAAKSVTLPQDLPVQSSPAASQNIFTKPLFPGLRNVEVKTLQDLLIRFGYLNVSSTGYFGPATQEAVKKFQCAKGIVCSGTTGTTGYGLVGSKTRSKLNELQK